MSKNDDKPKKEENLRDIQFVTDHFDVFDVAVKMDGIEEDPDPKNDINQLKSSSSE
ncbi:hypothetical protein [Laceyella putida]|uniref:Uncharacterized protein n=1 Tax=Laceyella putida TaxID=110101 RepID=A0ABW2RH48_9BACL